MDSVDIRVNWDLRDASASKKLDLKRYSYIESKQIWISMIKKDTQLFGSLGSQKILLDIRYLKKALGLLK